MSGYSRCSGSFLHALQTYRTFVRMQCVDIADVAVALCVHCKPIVLLWACNLCAEGAMHVQGCATCSLLSY